MVAYSFRPRFVEPILVGLGERRMHRVEPKRQTIRADRRRHARPGEELQLYTGMRTKRCRLIGKARCTSIAGIRIYLHGDGCISVDDYPAIRYGDLDAFAQRDGFTDWKDMLDFWRVEHGPIAEFEGVLITWEPLS